MRFPFYSKFCDKNWGFLLLQIHSMTEEIRSRDPAAAVLQYDAKAIASSFEYAWTVYESLYHWRR